MTSISITFGLGKRRGTISNEYRADGAKVKKVYTNSRLGINNNWVTAVTTTDYLDGFQYLGVTFPNGSIVANGLDDENELNFAMEREAFQQ